MRKPLLLHGAAIISSRKKLSDLKNKFDQNSTVVFGEEADLEDIKNNLVATPLFSNERLVILENPPEDFPNYQLLASRSEPTTNYQLILWFDHEVDTKKYRGFEILYFPESRELSVFSFLNKLGAKEEGAYLEMDKLKKGGYEGQYLIIMIFYLLRNLVATPKNAKDFVRDKNAKMRKNFTQENLIDLYKFVLETDFKIKTGLLEPDQAEFFLVKKFLFN